MIWLPIESAPRDGRTILLGYRNSNGVWRTMRGQWISAEYIAEYCDEDDEVWPGWYETCVEGDEPGCWPTTPTHYMDLPPEPEDA